MSLDDGVTFIYLLVKWWAKGLYYQLPESDGRERCSEN